jgi:hypothetical protein
MTAEIAPMDHAIHFICKREGIGRKNLGRVSGRAHVWRSGFWDLPLKEAQALVGGWVYLHETKSDPADFGGLVVNALPYKHEGVVHQDRVMLIFEARTAARGVAWRGMDHSRAWTSGLVEADLPHES